MLEIGIVPKYGTAGLGRFFPYTGYLGLSPVILAGTVHARLPPLCRPLGVRQVLATVKCIETRTCHSLPGGDVEAVIWEKTKRIWEPAGDAEYEDMGDWEGAFKLAVPVEAARMTASSQTTRDSKIVWKLELTFDHKPIPYVGTRITRSHLINMKSYAAPPSSPPTPQPAIAVPGAMIHVRPPVGAFGPGDTFSLEFDVVPDDPETSVRKGLVQLERRSELLAVQPDMSLAVPKQALEVRKPRQREKRSFFRRSRSTSADTSPSPVSPYEKLEDDIPSPPPTAQTPPTVVRSSVLEMNTPDPTVTSSGFSFVATGTVPRRGYKWDAGETGRTRLLATSFELRIRFALKTRKSGSKEVVCPPVPIVLVGASQEDRDAAQVSIAAASATKAKAGHPAKKRHRSSRRGLYMQEGTIEISDPVVHDTLDTLDPVPRRLSPLPPSPSIAPDTSEAGPSRPRLTARMSTGVKPILVRSQESPASTATQGISFALPPRASNPDSGSLQPPDVTLDSTAPSPTRHGGLNITDLIHPDYNPASPFSPKPSETSHTLNFAPFDSRSASFPHIGRRISDTQSEEEETQPSRSRQKRSIVGHQTNGSPTNFLWSNPDIKMNVTPATGVLPSSAVIPQPPDSSVPRPSLPSLDALGLGLPKVPEYDRTPRPRTAPSVSIFPNSAWNNVRNTTDSDAPRPVTSAGFGLGLHGGGSSVNLALVDPSSSSTTSYETGQSRLGVFANSSGMSSDTSFGSTRGLLPHHAPGPAYTLTNHAGESTSTIRAPTHVSVNASQRTITSVVPVPPPQRYEGYRVGAGSFAPAISQQQQQQAAMAAEEQRQVQAGEAPPPARRRSSVFGLGGRSFGRTEEGSFAFGLKG